ncbi:MAG: helix-turn-helix domain-containing protein [Solirubrobacterales bacterium]
MSKGGEAPSFRWDALVPQLVHPMRVAIIEALLYVERPLSATDMRKLLEGKFSVSFIAYHFEQLREAGAITRVGTRQVRGAQEKFYEVPSRMLKNKTQ